MFYKKIKSRKTFYKYLISYIVIFLLPLIMLSVLVFNYLFGVLQDEVMKNNFNTLKSSKNIIDTQIKHLKSVSEQVYTLQNLKPIRFKDNPSSAMQVINTLKNFVTTNSFYEDIVLYFPGDNYVYSSTSSNTISRFINEYYNYETWDEEQFYNAINTLVTPVVRPAEDVLKFGLVKEQVITFIYPLTYNGITPSKVLLFLVPEKSLNMLYENNLNSYNSNLIIIDSQGQYISTLTNEAYLQTDEFKNLYSSLKNESSEIVTLNGERYLSTFIPSTETDWKYLTLTPVKEVMQQVVTTKIVFIFFLFIILIIGAIVIYYLMTTNYKPLQMLKQYSEKLFTSQNMPSNDIELVKETLDYLNTANVEMYTRLQDSAQATREHLLIQLLKGRIPSLNTFNEQAKPFSMSFTKSIFRVLIIHINNLIIPEDVDITNLLEFSLSDGVEGYVTTYAEKSYYVLIVAYDNEDKLLIDSLPELQIAINKLSKHNPTIGIGEPYKEIINIPKSYMEALNAIDYRLIKGFGKIIYFNEISNISSVVDLSLYRVPEHLKTLIKQGNIERIENILVNISGYLKQNNTSLFTARMICSDVINTIVQALNELSIDYNIPKTYYPDVLTLSMFETVDEFVDIVRSTVHNIYDLLHQITEEENTDLKEQMISYIKDNYTDYDFSIQKMADHFNMALPNLSRYFKDNTNYNVLDYVTHLKIEITKALLSNSDMSIKDIASHVGYYNVTSFIRRFKQIVGLTPGEYRKQNKSLTK